MFWLSRKRLVGSYRRLIDEPVPGRSRVGLADSRLALVGQEVDVGAGVALVQRRRERLDPGLAYARSSGPS